MLLSRRECGIGRRIFDCCSNLFHLLLDYRLFGLVIRYCQSFLPILVATRLDNERVASLRRYRFSHRRLHRCSNARAHVLVDHDGRNIVQLVLQAIIFIFNSLLEAIFNELDVRLDVMMFFIVGRIVELYEALARSLTLLRLIVEIFVGGLGHWLRYVAARALCGEQREITLGRLGRHIKYGVFTSIVICKLL